MISPNRIKWNNYSSLDFDLLTDISFSGDDGEIETHLGREAVASESYNGILTRTHSYKWNEKFSPTLTFTKNDFGDFTQEENRKILKWLTGKSTASFMDVYMDDSEVIEWCALGNWINIKQYKISNERVIGYVAQFESITPWAFSPLRTITKTISDPTDNTIIINIKSDDSQNPIYPRITIQQDAANSIIPVDHVYTDQDEWLDGTVYEYDNTYYWVDADGIKHTSNTNTSNIETTSVILINTYTMNDVTKTISSKIKNNNKNEKVVLDGANRVVSSDRIAGRIFGNDYNWTWLPLFEGYNELSILGNCVLTIEYRTVIKCGEY